MFWINAPNIKSNYTMIYTNFEKVIHPVNR